MTLQDLVTLVAVVAAAAHVGVQWVVHLVVYPALAEAARTSAAGRVTAQVVHGRRMAVAILPVYAGIVLSTVLLAVDRLPGGGPGGVLAAVAVLLVVAVLVVTGLGAVPVHQALRTTSSEQREELHRQLRRVDRVRLVLAVLLLGVVTAAALAAT